MNDDNLHSFIEPELEARIVALVLGEASDFEQEELERLIKEKPELAMFRDRMESLHGMLRQIGSGEVIEDEADWKLSQEKRDKVLEAIGKPHPRRQPAAVETDKEPREAKKIVIWRNIKKFGNVAAVAAVILGLGAVFFLPALPGIQMKVRRDPEAARADVERTKDLYDSYAYVEPEIPDSTAFSNADAPEVATIKVSPVVSAKPTMTLELAQNSKSRNIAIGKERELEELELGVSRQYKDFDGVTPERSNISALNGGVSLEGWSEADEAQVLASPNSGVVTRGEAEDNKRTEPERRYAQIGHGGRSSDLQPERQSNQSDRGRQSEEPKAKPAPAVVADKDAEKTAKPAPGIAGRGGELETERDFGMIGHGGYDADNFDASGNVDAADAISVIAGGGVALNVTPDVVAFDGFVNYGSEIDSKSSGEAKKKPATQVLGRDKTIAAEGEEKTVALTGTASVGSGGDLLVRSSSGSITVTEDGSSISDVKDKVPVLGDIPVVGTLFKKQKAEKLTMPSQQIAQQNAESRYGDFENGAEKEISVGYATDFVFTPEADFEDKAVADGAVAKRETRDSVYLRRQMVRKPDEGNANSLGFPASNSAENYASFSANDSSEKLNLSTNAGGLAWGVPNSGGEVGGNQQSRSVRMPALQDLQDMDGDLPAPAASQPFDSGMTVANRRGLRFKQHAGTVRIGGAFQGMDADSIAMPEVQTAAEPEDINRLYAVVPKVVGGGANSISRGFTTGQSVQREWQRNPGHPATTELSSNLQRLDSEPRAEWYGRGVGNNEVTEGLVDRRKEQLERLSELKTQVKTKGLDVLEAELADANQESDVRKLATLTNEMRQLKEGEIQLAPIKADEELAALAAGEVDELRAEMAKVRTELEKIEVELTQIDVNGTIAVRGQSLSGGKAIDVKMIDDLITEAEEGRIAGKPVAAELFGVAGVYTEPNFQQMREQLQQASVTEIFSSETKTTDSPFSTFSLNVSDASFQLARAALAKNEWPDADRIRIEEFVNAFDYGDPVPTSDDKVAAQIEQAAHPFLQQRNLLRLSMRTATAGRGSGTPLRLTFLLDNSGSMERADRQETVRRAFAMLAGLMQPEDQVTLISFARQPRLLADKVSGNKANELVDTIQTLPSEGGTNLEAALKLAFEKAQEQQIDNAQNRIVLLTDGAANLGDADPESLSRRIETMREAGIAFDAAGIGTEGLNDEILEALTRKGDGRYYLLDGPHSVDAGFAKKIAGAFRPAAKNVKVQVEFNPKRVPSYQLLGFEKHRLKKEDFRNDKVDAAELAAEEAGVALYHFEADPQGSGDIGFVSVRFLDMSTGQMVERKWLIPYQREAPALVSSSPSLQLASTAALFAAKLKGGPLGDVVALDELAALSGELPGKWQSREAVASLRSMIETARELEGK